MPDTIREYMEKPDVPVIKRMAYGKIGRAFIRLGELGRIYYAYTYGRETLHVPVLANGSVLLNPVDFKWPTQMVDIVSPDDLGITELQWVQ